MRVALLGDLSEEKRRSMDLCGSYITRALQQVWPEADFSFHVPTFQPYLSQVKQNSLTQKIDLLVNRHFTYSLPKDKVDIYHIIDHSYAHLLHRLPPQKTIVTCHDLNIYYRMKSSKNPLFQVSCQHIISGLSKTKWAIIDSEFTLQQLEQHQLIPNAQKIVIPLGVDGVFRILESEQINLIAYKYKLSSGPYLIHVGDCFERKNIESLLEILAQVRREIPVQLLKIGGEFTPAQQFLIQQLQIQDAILHLTGVPVEDLVALYNYAEVCVFPSWLEGFGFPVLEAMACGTPVVATSRSSVPELVGDAGYLVDPADIEGYTAIISQLLKNPSLHQQTVVKGLTRVKQFTWPTHAQQTIDVYKRVLGQ